MIYAWSVRQLKSEAGHVFPHLDGVIGDVLLVGVPVRPSKEDGGIVDHLPRCEVRQLQTDSRAMRLLFR